MKKYTNELYDSPSPNNTYPIPRNTSKAGRIDVLGENMNGDTYNWPYMTHMRQHYLKYMSNHPSHSLTQFNKWYSDLKNKPD